MFRFLHVRNWNLACPDHSIINCLLMKRLQSPCLRLDHCVHIRFLRDIWIFRCFFGWQTLKFNERRLVLASSHKTFIFLNDQIILLLKRWRYQRIDLSSYCFDKSLLSRPLISRVHDLYDFKVLSIVIFSVIYLYGCRLFILNQTSLRKCRGRLELL